MRKKEEWLRLLPAVYKMQNGESLGEKGGAIPKEGLKAAWTYNNLLKEESKGVGSRVEYRFDNSKEMGSGFANSMSE